MWIRIKDIDYKNVRKVIREKFETEFPDGLTGMEGADIQVIQKSSYKELFKELLRNRNGSQMD